ncbi:MAG: SGNH/GDSL hydrolase family protein [Chromatiales bacterium]|nr:MAG: SGNH/GDSL hydrolase family protein [Chromatiales bacterium]
MSNLGKNVREYLVIVIVTLVVVEIGAFGILVWRSAAADDTILAQAIKERVRQHPLFRRRAGGITRASEYVFQPPTQYAFRANARFSNLQVGRHGFILNGPDEAEPFPDKTAGLKRLVLLGGSSAAGATASGNDKTIAAQLERLLNAGSDARYQVLNFGVGGNYTYGELQKLITEVAYLQPDAVIMFDGFNDAHYSNLEHLRAGLDAPLMNWADFSYQYFDAMAGLRGSLRAAPPVMTYAYLLVAEWLGGANSQSLRQRRAALYAELPAQTLSDWVASRDPRFESVLQTNLDLAAAWSARQNTWFFGYLQPHPWEYKNLDCERAAGTKLMVGRLGPTVDEVRYADIMRTAFQGYAKAYGALDQAYASEAQIRFIDLRQLFDGVADCIYNDPIHYNDQGNQLIARQMYADLQEAGFLAEP